MDVELLPREIPVETCTDRHPGGGGLGDLPVQLADGDGLVDDSRIGGSPGLALPGESL
ncbi:hypothetical protein [Streptomyces sp. V1I1]|uniref:hypothetical protein n=1 Tax=Streptomyces sp. V1I1 TaxID=3042272 RepID=UPI00277F519C|nr:hypothetical protein [Streptomyces sp. V1I1]MDQ0945715.1 hypothetical protein [Streptomyces sp. V1I1]